jgi:gliding motility-associated protein GldM|tara:strand:+ start:215 stop:1948 length:1734 start_codon:yes stop_codon:yes gene_type:complete
MAGKLDSRQKMINMMYLVFIAMLALNIGKEVLATLGILNNDLESSIVELEASSKASYAQINDNKDKLSYKIAASNVSEMKSEADSFYSFIDEIKNQLLVGEDGNPNKYLEEVENQETGEMFPVWKYQEMDKSEKLDLLFFSSDGITEKGEEFISKYSGFSGKINNILDQIIFLEEESKMAVTQEDGYKPEDAEVTPYDFAGVIGNLNNRFKYDDRVLKEDGSYQDYLQYNFEGFPVVASLAKLTKIQSDIRYIENKVLSDILLAITGGATNFTNFESILVPGKSGKNVFYTSDVVDSQIKLGKSDDGFEFDKVELKINGTTLNENEYSIVKGAIILKKRLTSAGTYNLTGTLTQRDAKTQEDKTVTVDQNIVIATEPNSAVVSADNMKVFYRGLRNPVSISIAGVNANTIVPSSKNGKFSKNGSAWTAQPTNVSAKSMSVSVSGVLNGTRRSFNGGTFRIENAPDGLGSVRVNKDFFTTGNEVTKRNLRYGAVTGKKPDNFNYDYEIIVTSFDVKIGNSTNVSVNGNSIDGNANASKGIENASKGTVVIISKIKASTKDGDLVTPGSKVAPFFLTIK